MEKLYIGVQLYKSGISPYVTPPRTLEELRKLGLDKDCTYYEFDLSKLTKVEIKVESSIIIKEI